MAKRNFIELFESRKGHLDYRLKRDYVRNGIATIPCRVSDYSDVISAYSVKGCETLNPEFDAYLKSTAELMPPECPLVLNIIGNCLSREEQKTVEETIRDDLAYDLGVVEKKEKRHTQTFFLMLAGMLLSGGIAVVYESAGGRTARAIVHPVLVCGGDPVRLSFPDRV